MNRKSAKMLAFGVLVFIAAHMSFNLAAEPIVKVEYDQSTLFDNENTDEQVYIFVHGIIGDRLTTWGMLPELISNDERVRNFDFLFWGFSSDIFEQTTIDKIGLALGSEIDLLLSEKGYKKVTIVAHSMGGLVARSLIISRIKEAKEASLKPIVQLITVATPHHGSDKASLIKMLDVIGANRQVADMDSYSSLLAEINRQWQIHIAIPSEGDAKWKGRVTAIAGIEDMVVPHESAVAYFPETISLQYGHRDIVKPKNERHMLYRTLVNIMGTSARVVKRVGACSKVSSEQLALLHSQNNATFAYKSTMLIVFTERGVAYFDVEGDKTTNEGARFSYRSKYYLADQNRIETDHGQVDIRMVDGKKLLGGEQRLWAGPLWINWDCLSEGTGILKNDSHIKRLVFYDDGSFDTLTMSAIWQQHVKQDGYFGQADGFDSETTKLFYDSNALLTASPRHAAVYWFTDSDQSGERVQYQSSFFGAGDSEPTSDQGRRLEENYFTEGFEGGSRIVSDGGNILDLTAGNGRIEDKVHWSGSGPNSGWFQKASNHKVFLRIAVEDVNDIDLGVLVDFLR